MFDIFKIIMLIIALVLLIVSMCIILRRCKKKQFEINKIVPNTTPGPRKRRDEFIILPPFQLDKYSEKKENP